MNQRLAIRESELPEFLKPHEVAEFLGVSRNTIYRWCKSGELEKVKVRNTLRIKKSTLLSWVTARERGA